MITVIKRQLQRLTKRRRPFYIGSALFVIFLILVLTFSFKLNLYRKKSKAFNALEGKIEQCSKQLEGDFSFIIKDLSFSKLVLSFKEDEKFPAASLIKLPILAVALKAIREGKISLEQEETFQEKDCAAGSGIIKERDLPIKLPLKRVLELMITCSDNTATNRLISLLGFDYINHSFTELGLKGTVLKRKMMDFYKRKKGVENYLIASDIVFLLEKVYRKELINKKSSRFALALLLDQRVKDRLPRYLFKEVTLAHKTGLERGIIHDAGIIFTSRGNYIICVLTKDVKKHKQAKKFIARLSLLTYNLYQ